MKKNIKVAIRLLFFIFLIALTVCLLFDTSNIISTHKVLYDTLKDSVNYSSSMWKLFYSEIVKNISIMVLLICGEYRTVKSIMRITENDK